MSGSESEGEQIRKLLQPEDPISYVHAEGKSWSILFIISITKVYQNIFLESKPESPKSQRYLEDDQQEDYKITASDLLSEIIHKQLEYSKREPQRINFKTPEDIEDREIIRLFSDSKTAVALENLEEQEYLKSRKKVPILKRKVEDVEISECQKIRVAAFTTEDLTQEVSRWTERSIKIPVIEYKIIKSIGYLREPENEFTKLAKKNGWSDSKISKTKYFNPSLQEGVNKKLRS